MNRPTLLTTLILLSMFSSTSFGEWAAVVETLDGNTLYVEFETIKKDGGHVYYWRLTDYLKPNKSGDLSVKSYNEVDCGTPLKWRGLSYLFYSESMGRGSAISTDNEKREWLYPVPGSSGEDILKVVCTYAKKVLP